ncbi:MAG: YdbL family protein [Candidatus Pacebacteria bacterium]|nr:YdbL family protein [Candidatus Paceibacterota bacterium]
MRHVISFFAIAALFIVTPCTMGAEDDLSAVIQRMKQRVNKIAQLKQDRVIGETKDGYLAVVNPPESQQAWEQAEQLVKAENKDRKTVYKAIAERTGTSIDQVARQRAFQIYENSKAGVLLQKPNGAWYEKK